MLKGIPARHMPGCARSPSQTLVEYALHADADGNEISTDIHRRIQIEQSPSACLSKQIRLISLFSHLDPIRNCFPLFLLPVSWQLAPLKPPSFCYSPKRLPMATTPTPANLGASLFSSRSLHSPSLPFFSISSLPHTSPFKNLNSSLFFLSPSPFSPSQTHRVSTAPVEQAPAPHFGFDEEISKLNDILSQLRGASSLKEKIMVLDSDCKVRDFFGNGNGRMMSELEPFEVYLLKCLVVAGQEHVLGFEFDWGKRVEAGGELRKAFYALGDMIENWSLDNGNGAQIEDVAEMEMLKVLLKLLGQMELFYDCIGGIIGYQIMALELLAPPSSEPRNSIGGDFVKLHVPTGFNLLENPDHASQAALWGIEV